MRRYYSPPVIENEEAYARAIEARIKANKIKGNRKRWTERFPDAQLLNDWLWSVGEFHATQQIDPRCESETDQDGNVYVVEHWWPTSGRERCSCKRIEHPLAFYARGQFLDRLRDALDQWGGLTEGQHLALRRSYEQAQDKLAGRDEAQAQRREEDAKSVHVGTVGERRDWVLTVAKVVSIETQFGYLNIHICRDEAGNLVVYKGSQCWQRGATLKGKATVKAHEVRDDVKQTIIQRPKLA